MVCRDFFPRLHIIKFTYKKQGNNVYILEWGCVKRAGENIPVSQLTEKFSNRMTLIYYYFLLFLLPNQESYGP